MTDIQELIDQIQWHEANEPTSPELEWMRDLLTSLQTQKGLTMTLAEQFNQQVKRWIADYDNSNGTFELNGKTYHLSYDEDYIVYDADYVEIARNDNYKDFLSVGDWIFMDEESTEDK